MRVKPRRARFVHRCDREPAGRGRSVRNGRTHPQAIHLAHAVAERRDADTTGDRVVDGRDDERTAAVQEPTREVVPVGDVREDRLEVGIFARPGLLFGGRDDVLAHERAAELDVARESACASLAGAIVGRAQMTSPGVSSSRTTGNPAAAHARMPPIMFAASKPHEISASAARADRAPERHTHTMCLLNGISSAPVRARRAGSTARRVHDRPATRRSRARRAARGHPSRTRASTASISGIWFGLKIVTALLGVVLGQVSDGRRQLPSAPAAAVEGAIQW